MRFVTFSQNGRIRPGVLLSEQSGTWTHVLDGAHSGRPAVLRNLKPCMLAWVQYGLPRLSKELRAVKLERQSILLLSDVQLCAPLPNAGKIVGAAFNYRDALLHTQQDIPAEPTIFIKSPSTIIGPGDEIRIDRSNNVTYEVELAVIIGRQALKVARENAMDYVSGYTIFNDVSVTNYVKEDKEFVRGKNQPFTGPLGPWIVSANEVADPYDIAMKLEIDGRTLQDSNTSQMLYDIEALIEYISAKMPLDVGDIIATGTPVGVAANHDPPMWLKPGMAISARLEGLGELINPVSELT